MAFGGRELRLILSIQSYGTSNFAKVRRDIADLERATKAANLNSVAVQQQMVRKAEQLAKTQDRINVAEQAAINKRNSLLARAARAELMFAQRRTSVANKEVALANAVASKRLQIGKATDRLGQMQGSGVSKFAIAENNLLTRRLQLQNQIGAVQRSGLGLEAQSLRNQAAKIASFRALAKVAGGAAKASQYAANPEMLSTAGARVKELVYRYQAVRKDAEKIKASQAAIPGQVAALNSQLETVLLQEKLITEQKYEQAAAIGRQAEVVALQRSQLDGLVARQGEIQAQIAGIDKQEALVNEELGAQLRLLENENIQLQRARVLVGEQAAEMERLGGIQLRNAAAADAAIVRQNKLLKQQTTAQTAGHVGRAAQFTGLLGVAGLALAGSAAARFSQQLVLAATQARDLNAPFAQVAQRTQELEHGFDQGGKHLKGILELMQEFPATADEMAQSAYDIYSSMRVSFGEGLNLLKTFNQLAVATGGDLPTATNAGITVLNDFSDAGKNVNKTLNLMVSIIRFGRLHLDEFNQMLNKVAPAAQASSQSLEDVAGAMAFLTTRIPSQAQASTGIARLLQTFRDPDFQKGTYKFGVDITRGAGAVGRLKPLPVILNQMAKSFGLFQSKGGPGQLFKELTSVGAGSGQGRQSRIEAINAYTLLIKNIKDYNTLQKLTTGDTVEFQRALTAMSAAPGVRWQVFQNQMRAFLITIGETALPALLKFAEHLQKIAHWFEGLSNHTRDLIGKFAVFGSISAVLGGTLLSMIGNIARLIIMFKLSKIAVVEMGTEAEVTAGKVGMLANSMKILGGIGLISIPIVMQIIKGGDPGLWTFLGGALSGAAGGAMIGSAIPGVGTAIGAVAGAITVPVVIDLISHFQDKKMSAAKKAYGNYIKEWSKTIKPGAKVVEPMNFEEWLKVNPKYMKMENDQKKHLNSTSNFLKNYKKLLKQENKDTIDGLLQQQKQLEAVYNAQNNKQSEANQRAVSLAKAHANAMQEATTNMNQKIDAAVKNLSQIYDSFEQMNKQALGTIGQGPTMSGILGQVFGNINDTLRQFGTQIPIPFQILRKDMNQQMSYFRRWRRDLDKLTQRLGPKGFQLVQELEQLGPTQGISIAEGLLGTNPKNLRKYLSDYKTINDEVKTASKKDMQKQLNDWMRHGKDIAWAIINGLKESEALMADGFKRYVTDNFGSILKTEFDKEVAAAMANAVQDLNAAAAAKAAQDAATAKAVKAAQTAGKTTTKKAPVIGLTMAQAIAAVRSGHQPFRDPWMQQGYIQGIGAPSGTRDARFAQSRTIQNVYHGDNITVQAGTPQEFAAFVHRRDFQRRTRGNRR